MFKGKLVIITGAARGIGRATAVAFAKQGATIAGIDIAGPVSDILEVVPATTDDLLQTGKLVETAGGKWRDYVADQRDPLQLQKTINQIKNDFGRVDIVFANAGIQAFKPLIDMEPADWHDQIDVNLNGTYNVIKAVLPHLIENGGGRIIVTSSTQGQHGTKYGAAYSASKWGIIGLMKSAALELGQYGITVNAVIPGLIDTPLTRHRQRYAQAIDEIDNSQPLEVLEERARQALSHKSPLGVAWIEPEAVAPVVVFLASDAANMISGATFDATGGDSANNCA